VSVSPSTSTVSKVQNRQAIGPPRVAIELRDVSGALLSREEQDLGELAWDREGREAEVRFDIPRLPLVEGRFQASPTA
jgi:hypothetical protein